MATETDAAARHADTSDAAPEVSPDAALVARARELAGERFGRSVRFEGGAALFLSAAGATSAATAATGATGATARGSETDGRAAAPSLAVLATGDDPLLSAFEGERHDAGEGLGLLVAPTTAANAAALRGILPNLRPVPIGLATSAGFGDRLGMATPGHVAAMERVGAAGTIAPVFAQQSIREMTRTRRSPQEVMDDATWGAFEAGWRHPVGADADHQKTPDDVNACLAAGFTLFTIDPGEHVDDSAETATPAELEAKLAGLPWAQLEDDWVGLKRRLLGSPIDLGDGSLTLDEASLVRAAVKYGAAIAHAVRLHRVLVASGRPFELELSVDETAHPTSLAEHAYVATELKRLGVDLVALAPRFVGRFEKGVDFRPDASGDLGRLAETLGGHARIARALGPYKLSLHSGSDKFSVYPLIARATRGLVHLKTAGTSYLEALRVAALHAPDIFRRALEIGHERFETDRKSYLIGAQLSNVPRPGSVSDARLPALLDDDDARQVLHVTFGSALDALGHELKAMLTERWREHAEGLAHHFERHLEPFTREEYADVTGVDA